MMILTVKELSCLLVHLNLMRDSVKKGFKRAYGRNEGKHKLNVYDSVKKAIEGNFERLGDNQEETVIHLLEDQKIMLNSFLDFYTKEIEKKAKEENIDYQNNEVLETLKRVHNKLQVNFSPSFT